jgi:3-hydroxyacyl-CoA dehydrogenase
MISPSYGGRARAAASSALTFSWSELRNSLMRRMVADGMLGKKSGQGFYRWDG